jgi:hypothetical protein
MYVKTYFLWNLTCPISNIFKYISKCTLNQENNVTKPIIFWGGKATIHAANNTCDQDFLSWKNLPLPEMAKVLSSVRMQQRNFFFFNLIPKATINGRT